MSRCCCLDGKVCLGQLEVCRLPRRPPVQQQHRPGHGEGNLQPWQRVQGALLLQYGAHWCTHGGKVVDNVGATTTTSARASSDLPSHNGSLGEHFTYLWTTLQLTNGIPVACHNCCSAIILPPSISWLNIVNIFLSVAINNHSQSKWDFTWASVMFLVKIFNMPTQIVLQSAFFNCSSRFSVPKWNTMGSQSEILFHEILDVQKILVQRFSF